MKNALIVVDMQNDYYIGGKNELTGIKEALENMVKLINKAHKAGDEVIFIQHISKKDAPFFVEGSEGAKLHKELPIQSQDSVVVKHYPNSFRETNLHQLLQAKNISNLTICGAMTHMCIDTTVRAAFDLGYKTTLVGNACATKDLSYKGDTIEAKYVQASFLSALDCTFCEVIEV